MEFSSEELDLESLEVENSDIELSSSSVKCEICKTGNVVRAGRESQLVLYTRTGPKKGVHIEKRCNNRTTQCRAGHYYGYVKSGTSKVIDDDALKLEYLVTSNQTAFSVDYLWDMTLQILLLPLMGLGKFSTIFTSRIFLMILFKGEKMSSLSELLRLSTSIPILSLAKGMILKCPFLEAWMKLFLKIRLIFITFSEHIGLKTILVMFLAAVVSSPWTAALSRIGSYAHQS